jgi:hypothetical protein
MDIFRLWLRAQHTWIWLYALQRSHKMHHLTSPRIFRLFMTPGKMWATPSAGSSQQIHSSRLLARFHAAAHRRPAASSSRGRLRE